MLTEKFFKQQIALLSENFNFQITPEYLKLIFGSIKNITSNEIFAQKAQSLIFNKKVSDWNKDYGFNGKPAVADFIDIFCVKRQEIPCEPYREFSTIRSSRLETYAEALKREISHISIETNSDTKKLTN